MQRENPPPSELDPVSLLSDLIAPESANPGRVRIVSRER